MTANQTNLEAETLLQHVLTSLPWAITPDGHLNKTALIALLNRTSPTPPEVAQLEALLQALHDQPTLKQQFFTPLASTLVFKKDDFLAVVCNKAFLPDSYTAYANYIGLNVWGQHLKDIQDVVLDFPYKECVLEGGQTHDDDKGTEVFYNEVLARTAVTRLKLPKAFANVTKYSKANANTPAQGQPCTTFDPTTDNLLIKGNNYIALHSLLPQYKGKVKLIYIDPPYNTGNDSFKYNDSFSHSTWLVFMKNRLEVARDLLKDDGVLVVQLDDNEAHYCKLLADSVFGRGNFINNVVWEKKYAPQNDAKWFSDNHDHILFYAKNKELWRPNLLPRTDEMNARYKNPDNDPRGVWKTSDLSVKRVTPKDIYEVTTPTGRKVLPPKGRSWAMSQDNFQSLVKDNRIWFGQDGNSIPQLKRFITDVKQGTVAMTIWLYQEVGHNQDAKNEVKDIFDEFVFTTPKPEKLIQRIVALATNEGDIVLDYHAGSGTTAAVAHKMGRRWVTIEQMDYIQDITCQRLLNVLNGDQTGVSKTVGWPATGGGSFIYAELAEDTMTHLKQLEQATTQAELDTIRHNLVQHRAIRLDLNTDAWLRDPAHKFKQGQADLYFNELPLHQQKHLLRQVINKNKLYVLADNVDDEAYAHLLTPEDKAFTHSFYQHAPLEQQEAVTHD